MSKTEYSLSTKLKEFVLAATWIDVPLVAVATVAVVTISALPPATSEAMRATIYSGAAAFGGLALAAATFACAMTYQSANVLLSHVRVKYAQVLRRNWTSIIVWMLLSAVLPLLSAGLDSYSVRWAAGATGFGLCMTLVKALRAIFWLGYTIFMDELEQERPTIMAAPSLPERLR